MAPGAFLARTTPCKASPSSSAPGLLNITGATVNLMLGNVTTSRDVEGVQKAWISLSTLASISFKLCFPPPACYRY